MDGFWIIIIVVAFGLWVVKSITVPARSADTLKRIEEELKRRK
ncbi:MAG TPA: hypothetical protein VGL66_19315 [Caulobacteraceae bacterium]|jgi:hypothetical protein